MQDINLSRQEILNTMVKTLCQSFYSIPDKNELLKTYEYQLSKYEHLFVKPSGNEKGEGEDEILICGRCIISASRSLINRTTNDLSFEAARGEIKKLEPLFEKNHMPDRAEISRVISSAIENLSKLKTDEIVDAVLFVYMSVNDVLIKKCEASYAG